MKKNNTRNPLFSFSLLFALVFIFSSSCRRNKECDLKISVQDAVSSGPVVGATVHVYPKPGTGGNLKDADLTSTTDGTGIAMFTFKYPAMLQVDITPPSPYLVPAPTLVKLEEGKSVSKAILVYQ